MYNNRFSSQWIWWRQLSKNNHGCVAITNYKRFSIQFRRRDEKLICNNDNSIAYMTGLRQNGEVDAFWTSAYSNYWFHSVYRHFIYSSSILEHAWFVPIQMYCVRFNPNQSEDIITVLPLQHPVRRMGSKICTAEYRRLTGATALREHRGSYQVTVYQYYSIV